MSEEVQKATETGIDVSNYTEERDKGLVAISKPVKNSGNYIYMRATFTVETVSGVPQAVEGNPVLRNINRQSITDFLDVLQKQEDQINAVRAQLAAVSADMDALDAE